MYKHFFELRENPFNVNPDPRYLYLTPQTSEALDELTYGIQARKGLILLTGEVGTGKTTLINRLLDWLREQQTPTAFIFNSHLEASHLFDFMLSDFGVPYDSRWRGNALMRLNQWLFERHRAGETPVLIVDEAQGMPTCVLEEIRMLLNLETPHEKLLQIVLAGQPELDERLNRNDLRQLKQRVVLRCKTSALTLEETHEYIEARLRIAGAGDKPIFASQAMSAVHYYSRGIPRIVNLLCEHALINAYVDLLRPVPVHIVEEVAREFQFDEVRPLAPPAEPAEATSTHFNAGEPTNASARVPPFAATVAASVSSQKQHGASMTRDSAAFDAGDAGLGAINESMAPALACEEIPVMRGQIKSTGSLSVPLFAAAAAAAPEWAGTNQLSDPASRASDAGIQLIVELGKEIERRASTSSLHVVESKAKTRFTPTLATSPPPRSQNLAHAPIKPSPAK
ncbi:MAG: ExeA family protein, partial [Candidatus Acidiferrales bacterium]